ALSSAFPPQEVANPDPTFVYRASKSSFERSSIRVSPKQIFSKSSEILSIIKPFEYALTADFKAFLILFDREKKEFYVVKKKMWVEIWLHTGLTPLNRCRG